MLLLSYIAIGKGYEVKYFYFMQILSLSTWIWEGYEVKYFYFCRQRNINFLPYVRLYSDIISTFLQMTTSCNRGYTVIKFLLYVDQHQKQRTPVWLDSNNISTLCRFVRITLLLVASLCSNNISTICRLYVWSIILLHPQKKEHYPYGWCSFYCH